MRPRLRFEQGNVVKVVDSITGRHEVERILSSLPARFFVASFPIPEAEASIRVEPRRATAYVIVDRVKSSVYVVSTRRIRVVIDSGENHVMVPGRLVDRDIFQATLLL